MLEKLKSFFGKLPEVKEQAKVEQPEPTIDAKQIPTPTFIQQLEEKVAEVKKPRKPRTKKVENESAS